MIPALAFLAALLAPPADTLPKPRLVAKGDTYLVHITPGAPSTAEAQGRSEVVTHTRRDTGYMTVLASASAAPRLTDRLLAAEFGGYGRGGRTVTTTIAGIRCDAERAYVLVTHWAYHPGTPAMGPFENRTYGELRVFWLADGSRVGTFAVEKAEHLQRFAHFRFLGQPEAAIDDAGPLKADVGGVSVAGQVFRFEGKKHVAAVADSPTAPRPAVTFLASLQGFAIHAVHPLPLVDALQPTPGTTPGTTILYVPFDAAQARPLLQTGDRAHPREKAAGDDRPPRVTQTRLVSTTCDMERLYVLVWHSEWQLDGPGLRVGPVLPQSDDYRLYVVWLADGSDLAVIKLTGGQKTIPAESVSRDLLAAHQSGVKVFEQTITFKGKERVK